MTNLLNQSRRELSQYKCFKTYLDRDGKFFPDGGARYAIFCDGWLVGEYLDSCTAERKWRADPVQHVKLADYAGIDARLKI